MMALQVLQEIEQQHQVVMIPEPVLRVDLVLQVPQTPTVTHPTLVRRDSKKRPSIPEGQTPSASSQNRRKSLAEVKKMVTFPDDGDSG